MTEEEQNEKLGWERDRRPMSVADIVRRRTELNTLYSVLDAEESILQVPFFYIFFSISTFPPSERSTEALPLGTMAE